MFLKDYLLVATPFSAVFEGEIEPPIDPPVDPPVPAQDDKNKNSKVKFTPEQQAFVNSILAAEKQKAQAKSEQLILQLETEKNRGSTTAAEKLQLEERIETLKNEFITKDELKARESDKKLKELEQKLKHLEAEGSTYKTRWESNLKLNALTSAAAEAKAYNVDTVVTVLEGKTRLVEEVGEDGKPTGQFAPRVKIHTKDKDGKAVVLELDPAGAVKQLKEMPEYMNLFISPAQGGLGAGSLGRGIPGSSKPVHEMDTSEYLAARRKARKDGTNRS